MKNIKSNENLPINAQFQSIALLALQKTDHCLRGPWTIKNREKHCSKLNWWKRKVENRSIK